MKKSPLRSYVLNPAILISIVTLNACAAPLATTELVRLSVKQSPVENGKLLNMEFQEIERVDSHSVAQVTFVSGGSVSSSMFVLRGMCAVARARGEKYFNSERIPSATTRYKITFPQDRPPPSPGAITSPDANRAFSTDDCTALGF